MKPAVAEAYPSAKNNTLFGARIRGILSAHLGRAVAVVFLIVAFAFPLYLLIINSFKSESEASAVGLGLPRHWYFSNYAKVIHGSGILSGLRNNIIVIVPSVLFIVLLASLAAWPLARHTTRSARFWYAAGIGGIFFPPAMVPVVLMEKALHLLTTPYLGLIVYYIGGWMPVAVFMICGFIKTIPTEVEEAARIDGCESWQIYTRIVLPLIRPVIATVFIFLLFNMWNDFYSPVFLLSDPSQQTLVLRLYNVAATLSLIQWNEVFAFIVLLAVPLIFVMVLMYRQFKDAFGWTSSR